MSLIVRPVGYTGGLQQLIWPYRTTAVFAYLWGGAGGGGGGDGGRQGGNGTGGAFAASSFTVNPGDSIVAAVGGSGGGGQGNRSSATGGGAGASLVQDTVFDTTQLVGGNIVRSRNAAYAGFLNYYGVWLNPVTTRIFDQAVTVNFPLTTNCTFTASCDNFATISLDGIEILSVPGFTRSFSTSIEVTAGNHVVRIQGTNTGGPGSVALTIDGGGGYSGGTGGRAGGSGSSGAGGGSGGATIVLRNGSPQAVAGGGAGGAGAGVQGNTPGFGPDAPGPWGVNSSSTAGQNGGNHPGDGGGGGGGGGGWQGGNAGRWGGATPDQPLAANDVSGTGGSPGLSLGIETAVPSGRTPGGSNNEYYQGGSRGGAGSSRDGGSGASGLVVFEFDVNGVYVHQDGDFRDVRDTYIKDQAEWRRIQTIYVKDNGVWNTVLGGTVPTFSGISGQFGISPNTAPLYPGQVG